MPIGARQQAVTTEERFAKVLEILSNMRNQSESQFMRDFILELCRRYIDKDKELKQHVSKAVGAMNDFETEYLERIVREFTL